MDYLYDCRYHVKTCGNVHFKNNRILNYDYEPSPYSELQKVFAEFSFTKDCHLIDYGCGKGRVLIVAALCGCPRVTGIELNAELCHLAEMNVAHIQKRIKENIDMQVVEQDAIQYMVDPSINYFFFYNPFHLKIFIYVLKNIQNSILQYPRDVSLVFLKPQKSTIWQVEKMHFFTLQIELENPRCLIYRYMTEEDYKLSSMEVECED